MEITKTLFISMLIGILIAGIALGIGIANDYGRESPTSLEQCEVDLAKAQSDFRIYEYLVGECDACIQRISGDNNTLKVCSESEE